MPVSPVGAVPVQNTPTLAARLSVAVPILLGSVLVTAAALKAYQMATEPVAETGFFGSRWLLIGLVEFELGLGLWLLSSFHSRLARLVAFIAFAVFLGVALSQALSGQSSCACFGKVRVVPWAAAAFDLTALILLTAWKPDKARSLRVASHPLRFAVLVMLALTLAVSAAVTAGSSNAAVAVSTDQVLAVSSEPINLGTVAQGGRSEKSFWISNPTDRPVELVTIQTTCPCLRIEMTDRLIAPAQKVAARAILDLSKEQAFLGDLAIEVKGVATEGTVVFVAVVKVKGNRSAGLGRTGAAAGRLIL